MQKMIHKPRFPSQYGKYFRNQNPENFNGGPQSRIKKPYNEEFAIKT